MARLPLFLERRGYRMRRLMDVVRVLPFIGLGFWLIPLMWPQTPDPAEGVATSDTLRYIFGIWLVLIIVTFLLWRRTKDFADRDLPPDEASEEA
ncbi:MAG: hypothetical protein HKN30_01575 [Sulfitobacter sp.]|nr:hypothetical protein [Sulfitobacter sp.]